MANARSRLLGNIGTTDDVPGSNGSHTNRHAGAQIGATMRKAMLAFVPHPDNGTNGGMAKSLAYAHLYSVDFNAWGKEPYSRLVLTFSGHVVTVDGANLKAMLDRIEAAHCDTVIQEETDPLQAKGRARETGQPVVCGLEIEPIGRG